MNVGYKIYELDANHLGESNYVFDNRDRICLVVADLGNWRTLTYDTFDQAVLAVENYGKEYTEYTIIPFIYKNNMP